MRSLKEIHEQIRDEWTCITDAAGTRIEAVNLLPASIRLFGGSSKTALGARQNYRTGVVYASPAREAFPAGDLRTLCPASTPGCEAGCLGHASGRMRMKRSENARLWKATLLLGARNLFREALTAEATHFIRNCERTGELPALRVDGCTDTGEGLQLWRNLKRMGLAHKVRCYDYTKVASRALRCCGSKYHVTFSVTQRTPDATLWQMHEAGVNLAVVLPLRKKDAIPAHWRGIPTIDGDAHDLRFLDAPGHAVILRIKGGAENAQRAGDLLQIATNPQAQEAA